MKRAMAARMGKARAGIPKKRIRVFIHILEVHLKKMGASTDITLRQHCRWKENRNSNCRVARWIF